MSLSANMNISLLPSLWVYGLVHELSSYIIFDFGSLIDFLSETIPLPRKV